MEFADGLAGDRHLTGRSTAADDSPVAFTAQQLEKPFLAISLVNNVVPLVCCCVRWVQSASITHSASLTRPPPCSSSKHGLVWFVVCGLWFGRYKQMLSQSQLCRPAHHGEGLSGPCKTCGSRDRSRHKTKCPPISTQPSMQWHQARTCVCVCVCACVCQCAHRMRSNAQQPQKPCKSSSAVQNGKVKTPTS